MFKSNAQSHMKLKRLVKDLPVQLFKGPKEVEITGVCANSKLVAPGNLFVARKGKNTDGALYIPEAIAGGASAILTDLYDPTLRDIAQLVHKDPNAIEALLASAYYRNPSEELLMVAITGTNGKTTTSFLIKHLLDALQGPCGLIGTIEHIIGEVRHQATRTTPDVCTNHKMLREMLHQGCRSAIMETTSHALDQGRVNQIDFDVAVFTNLSPDHLDYHGTMEEYCKAKNRLFRMLWNAQTKSKKRTNKTAVVNADSTWMPQILEGCLSNVLSYGIEEPADLRAVNLSPDVAGTSCQIEWQGRRYPCVIPLPGKFNIYNGLSALGAVISQGFDIEKAIAILRQAPPVSGRLEKVPNTLGIHVYVDFAHTEDALRKVLQCIREFNTGKIFCVFGCGGDRDKSKRAKMAQVSEEYADYTIVTSDNPRTEDPEKIAQEIAEGFTGTEYKIETNRKKAIETAIRLASRDDIVLIAGKGHETSQIFAHQTIEFDDRKVAAEICRQIAVLEQEPTK